MWRYLETNTRCCCDVRSFLYNFILSQCVTPILCVSVGLFVGVSVFEDSGIGSWVFASEAIIFSVVDEELMENEMIRLYCGILVNSILSINIISLPRNIIMVNYKLN